MLYLANPCGWASIEAMGARLIGLIDTPYQRKPTMTNAAHELGAAWCADNGAYTDKWTADVWWAWLQTRTPWASTCLFATAPDVVGDAAATEALSTPWLARIRGLGFPVAYVAQNGLKRLPWGDFDVLFLGGDTAWKLGPEARAWTAEAVTRGVPVHMGRVNSEKRFRYAAAIGCSSVDGTYLTYAPAKLLPDVLAWQRGLGQQSLF